ncbi:MAG: DUF3617 domain-containing protein [Gammaproteobacteria bacterium]|nr:DUF3617 domain-containing protein [Gammaproteobacteria bacterium]
MPLFLRSLTLSTIGFFLVVTSTQALAINAKPGMWEWTTTLTIPGGPAGIPVSAYKSCITLKDLSPKSPDNDHCKPSSQKIDDDRVDWQIQCGNTDSPTLIDGHLIYNSTTAMGESTISFGNSSISSTILGSYIGACK